MRLPLSRACEVRRGGGALGVRLGFATGMRILFLPRGPPPCGGHLSGELSRPPLGNPDPPRGIPKRGEAGARLGVRTARFALRQPEN